MVPSTLTEKLHEALAESCRPVKRIVEVPAVAVIVGAVTTEPVVQEMADKPLGVSITRPVGSVSEKLIALRAVVFGLPNVKVSVLALPCAIVVGEKLFESVGTTGRGHPVMVMPSRYIVPVVTEGLPPYCAPAA